MADIVVCLYRTANCLAILEDTDEIPMVPRGPIDMYQNTRAEGNSSLLSTTKNIVMPEEKSCPALTY